MKRLIIQRIRTICLLIACISLNCSCNDNEQGSIRFELRTTDHDGTYKSDFEFGQNVVFEFNIINDTQEDFKWPNDECRLLNNHDFLVVYKIENNNRVLVGRPFNTPVNCQLINLPDDLLPPGKHNIVRMAWQNVTEDPLYAENEPLEIGDYTTSFEFTLSNESHSFFTEVNFSVKN